MTKPLQGCRESLFRGLPAWRRPLGVVPDLLGHWPALVSCHREARNKPKSLDRRTTKSKIQSRNEGRSAVLQFKCGGAITGEPKRASNKLDRKAHRGDIGTHQCVPILDQTGNCRPFAAQDRSKQRRNEGRNLARAVLPNRRLRADLAAQVST